MADIHGSLHELNRDFEPTRSWVAHVGGRVTHMIARKSILVTLGVRLSRLGSGHSFMINSQEEESSRMPLLKIWDLEQKDKKTGSPLLLRSVKVQHGNRPHPVCELGYVPSNFLTPY